MKIQNIRFVLVTFLVMLPFLAGAQLPNFTARYPAGVEGMKGGSLPPPGIYLRDYNLFYASDDLRVAGGGPPGYRVIAYVNAPRVVWISPYKVLGGYYGADALVTIGYVNQRDDLGFTRTKGGIGDVFVEPITLSWHPQQWDIGVGYGFWAPTGNHDPNPRDPNLIWRGHWSHMLTAGATYYLDTNKTVSASVLLRYEINHTYSENYRVPFTPGIPVDIRPGQQLTLEWGISKFFTPTIEGGLVGYYQQQTTLDTGTFASNDKDRVLSIGPEINVIWPKAQLFTSLRYLYEFEAKDRPQGHLISLTLTKKF
jgi:hypothetical protein